MRVDIRIQVLLLSAPTIHSEPVVTHFDKNVAIVDQAGRAGRAWPKRRRWSYMLSGAYAR